jgi:hypothetical protein
MCCFSGTVSLVSDTCIFARLSGRGTQYLVYQMSFQTDTEVAMVLPIPVSSHAENAVRFLALDGYPAFFDDLEELFGPPMDAMSWRAAPVSAGLAMLEVHQVGGYDASFVPTIGDFDRLDPMFRLPEHVWEKLPQYADYGFAVFKLGGRAQETAPPSEPSRILTPWEQRLAYLTAKFRPKPPQEHSAESYPVIDMHPMAFEFPTALPDKIFFPTLHIHDGMIHSHEEFDHSLYWQGVAGPSDAERSPSLARSAVDLKRALGVIDGESPVQKLSVVGSHVNEDILVG